MAHPDLSRMSPAAIARAYGYPAGDHRVLVAAGCVFGAGKGPRAVARKTVSRPKPRPPRHYEGAPFKASVVLDAVCTASGFTIDELISNRRQLDLVRWRLVAYALLRARTDLSTPEIGRVMGRRHHTAVLHGVERFHELSSCPDHAAAWHAAVERLDGGLEG